MPPRDPGKPQLDFPLLIADLIAQLNIVGQIGVLDFSDTVQPMFIVGTREGALSVTSEAVDYTSAQLFSAASAAPGLNQVLADTGQLPAGTYDIQVGYSMSGDIVADFLFFQHRNAGNTADLSSLPIARGPLDHRDATMPLNFAVIVATNERLRFQIGTATTAGSRVGTWIMAKVRPAP